VEFRKKTGTFESSIPGSGLLVYRIDTSVGDGNADGPPDEVYIYRPGGTTTVNGTVNSANFSTEVGRTRINSSTNPAPFLQDGSAGNLYLCEIGSSAGSTISFRKGLPFVDFTVNPYVQGFDATVFPPDGWAHQAVSGTYAFERVTSGTNPGCSTQSGAGMLRYNSDIAPAGAAAFIASPRLACTDTATYNYTFSFWMYRDGNQGSLADRVEVYLNSSQDLNGSPTLLGTINRYKNFSPIAVTGWRQYSFILPLSAAGNYYGVLKAISEGGYNIFIDNVQIEKSLAPPLAAINPSPANLSTDIILSQVLSWQSGGGTISGYKLYLGTDNPPTNMENGTNLGMVTSYTRSGGWNYATPYYWKIVPTNAGGDADGCSIWSFTTMADSRITALPHQENFDVPTAPSLPTGWTSVVNSTSTYAYARSYVSTTYAVSAPNCIQLSNSSDIAADLRLVSPEILVPVNSIKFSFSARAGSSDYTLLVGTMNSPTGTFNQLSALTLSTTQTSYSISLGNYLGSDRYIAIKHGLGSTYRSIYLDNLLFDTLLANDLMVNSLEGFGIGVVGDTLNYQVSITNNGSQTQASYLVHLMANGNPVPLTSVQVSNPLLTDQTALHTLTWMPTISQDSAVYAKVVLASDANSANDSSDPIAATVYPADIYLPVTEDITLSPTANTLPCNFYWKNSVSETIYLAEELKMASGNIEGIVLFNNFVESLASKPIMIWMQNTSAVNLSSSWLPYEGYTLVFDGTIDFPLGKNAITIPLATAFAYSGENLALRCNRPMDTAYFSTNNHFYYSESTLHPSRSRELHSDTVTYDPTLLTDTGNLSNNIPITAFVISDAALATPIVQCNQNGTNLQLTWNAVLGAHSYQIYSTDNPLSWPDTPVALVSGTSYTCTTYERRFFKIVASSLSQ
jgi:hypothetical protein